MFKKPNYVEQFTKVNARLNDLHDAYRILLQNVNNLQKELYEKCSKKALLDVGDQVDYVENELHRIELNHINDSKDLNLKIKQLKNKLSDGDISEYTSTHPGQIYLEAKENFVAAKLDLLNTEIRHLEWTVRAANCFNYILKVETLKDLCSYSEKSLLKTKNLGQKTLNEIKSVLAQYDLKLREEDELDKNTPSAS